MPAQTDLSADFGAKSTGMACRTAFSDPNALPGNFFNVNSPRGVVFSTPGTGFLVSANAGRRNSCAVRFAWRLPGIQRAETVHRREQQHHGRIVLLAGHGTAAATTSAFGVIFTDVELAGLTKIEFFDASNSLIFSRSALVAGNQGLSFLGAVANAGERISRVRITSGVNRIVSNGVLGKSQ